MTDEGEAAWWLVTYEVEVREVDGEWKASATKPDLTFVMP